MARNTLNLATLSLSRETIAYQFVNNDFANTLLIFAVINT